MWIGDDCSGIPAEIFFDGDVVDLEIVIAKGESFVEDFTDIDFGALGLPLPREGEQILHNAVRALRLLEHFPDVVVRPLVQAFAFKELRIAENRRQRIVQLVSDARNQLSDG